MQIFADKDKNRDSYRSPGHDRFSSDAPEMRIEYCVVKKDGTKSSFDGETANSHNSRLRGQFYEVYKVIENLLIPDKPSKSVGVLSVAIAKFQHERDEKVTGYFEKEALEELRQDYDVIDAAFIARDAEKAREDEKQKQIETLRQEKAQRKREGIEAYKKRNDDIANHPLFKKVDVYVQSNPNVTHRESLLATDIELANEKCDARVKVHVKTKNVFRWLPEPEALQLWKDTQKDGNKPPPWIKGEKKSIKLIQTTKKYFKPNGQILKGELEKGLSCTAIDEQDNWLLLDGFFCWIPKNCAVQVTKDSDRSSNATHERQVKNRRCACRTRATAHRCGCRRSQRIFAIPRTSVGDFSVSHLTRGAIGCIAIIVDSSRARHPH